MLRFIVRRLLQLIPLVLGISFISFGVMKLAPGDFLTEMAANPQIKPEVIQQLRVQFGLNKPWYDQYALWLRNIFLHHNFGQSFAYNQPVFKLIGSFAEATLLLAVSSLLFSWLIAIPMGVYAARHRNSVMDRLMSLIAFSGISLPGFFVALLAALWAEKTGLLPSGGMTSINHDQLSLWGRFCDTGEHLILPTIVLGIQELSTIMRQMRGNLLDVMNENYVIAARARGLNEGAVVWKHGVRNAINPLITLLGYDLSGILSGAALVEVVMSWPGLGRLILTAVRSQDLYVSMAAFVLGAALLILGNLIADILLAVTDPRIKLG